ncbi:hypothetical protein HYX16_05040 [Candidatus Woesearchaeota archaeon]|nr:hypothetical protein [Candidatus Woesearchaeota archaeon]
MKGQASFEYVIMVGVVLVLLIPIASYVIYHSSQTIKINQADDAVKSIAKKADTVYALGKGSKSFVSVILPSGIINTSINNNDIIIVLSIYGGKTEIIAHTKANLVGSLPTLKGSLTIPIEMLDSGEVKIG